MTKFGELYRAYGYRGATFLSVSLDKKQDIWREKVRTLGLPSHQCASAEPDVIETRYALVSVPDFMLIAPMGPSIPQPDGDTVGTEVARTVTLSGEKRYCCVVCAGYHRICETIVNIVPSPSYPAMS